MSSTKTETAVKKAKSPATKPATSRARKLFYKPGTTFVRTEDAERNWLVIDATGHRVGRLATQLANLLRGKHKPNYTPNTDNGDFVIVINSDKLEFTGAKWTDKKYYRHSRFFGSLKEMSAEQKKASDPAFILSEAVRCMLPDNKLSYQLINKLKVFAGPEHNHKSQKPQAYTIAKSHQ